MAQMNRDEMIRRMIALEEEAGRSGPIHRRDLKKYLRKLKRELRDYDRFQCEAREAG